MNDQNTNATATEVKIQKRKAGRLTEGYLRSQYPHVVEGSLRWNDLAGKQMVTISCVDCGEERDVFTSDLFQISRCTACTKTARKAAKAAQKAAAKAAAQPVAVTA